MERRKQSHVTKLLCCSFYNQQFRCGKTVFQQLSVEVYLINGLTDVHEIVRICSEMIQRTMPYGGNKLPWRRSALSECFSSLMIISGICIILKLVLFFVNISYITRLFGCVQIRQTTSYHVLIAVLSRSHPADLATVMQPV